jgi:hypothetical protein
VLTDLYRAYEREKLTDGSRPLPMEIELPQQPPLELVHQGRVWTVAEYRQGRRDGTTFSSHDTQIDAVRAAKSKMERDGHPCVVRWESQDSVQNVYWNPLFEYLDVSYDELVSAWTVVPAGGTCAIESAQSRDDACESGKRLQREYDFKHLRVFDKASENHETRDHRFLRHNITDSGVRFDRSTLDSKPEQPEPEETTTEEDEPEIVRTGPATPGRLGVSIPDVTQVEFVDTDGVLNKYETPWGDGTRAQILALSQKYADHEAACDAVAARIALWQAADETDHVATVHESGTDPTPWVAYESGEYGLDEVGLDLSINDRARVVEAIAAACGTVSDEECYGIQPVNVRLRDESGWQVTVANWGIEWAVNTALSRRHATPFTAPEQTAGETTAQTAVYQLAAVAYWLLCEQYPVEGDLHQAIQAGQITPPATISAVPSAVEPVLLRGLSTDSAERHGSVHELTHELLRHLR